MNELLTYAVYTTYAETKTIETELLFIIFTFKKLVSAINAMCTHKIF